MNWKILLTIFFLLMVLQVTAMEKVDFFKEIPGEVNGWKRSDNDVLYTKDNLYDYINGGAELYLSYGFKRLWARKYQKKDQPEIVVDIFDMGSSENAYGVFSHSRETSSARMGQESEYSGGLLIFWKGQYYISILAYPENDLARKTVFEIGKRIDLSIKEPGKLPALISDLPSRGLAKESIRYFRHYIWLNSHFYISDKNILNIDNQTEAVLARYNNKGFDFLLLLVLYPDNSKAKSALFSFNNSYLPDSKNGICKTEDGKWVGSLLLGRKVWIILNADNQKLVKDMIDILSR